MLSHWPIKKKLLVGLLLLLVIVVTIAFSGFRGVYAYRGLARSVRHRVKELPLASKLAQSINDLRVTTSRIGQDNEVLLGADTAAANLDLKNEDRIPYEREFRWKFIAVQRALEEYRQQLEINQEMEQTFADNRGERITVAEMERSLQQVEAARPRPQALLAPRLPAQPHDRVR